MVKKALAAKTKNGKLQILHTVLKKCPCCQGHLYIKKAGGSSIVKATVFSSENISHAASQSKICWKCGLHARQNFVWLGGQKINCLTFNEMVASGLYFVSSKTAFTMKYLELCYYRLMRARTSPGQEASVRHLVHGSSEDMFWGHSSFRDHLLHALEGFAVARRMPDKVIEFNLDFPAKEVVKLRHPLLLFPPTSPVKEVAFDGHFGVHRALHSSEPPRSVAKKGRPMKLVQEYERSCHCKKKDAVRQVLPNRTAGWQFALDPKTGKVLGAFKHIVNEKNEDKVALLQAVLVMPQVRADLLVHDDACHFEQFVMKNKSAGFDAIKFYLVDTFHMRNHKCEKSMRSRKDKARLKNVRTSACEIFNAWLRPMNFFLNCLRPQSHKFWVQEACKFYNANLKEWPSIMTRRTTSLSRAKAMKRLKNMKSMKRMKSMK